MSSCWMKTEGDHVFFQMALNYNDVHGMLGDFEIIKLLSGDMLFVQEGYKNYKDNKVNDTASSVLGEPVYGDCILIEEGNYDSDRSRPSQRTWERHSSKVSDHLPTDTSSRSSGSES